MSPSSSSPTSKSYALPSGGLFTVFEGLDGSGKSSLVANLYKELTAADIPAVKLFEPTKNGAGAVLRRLFAGEEPPDPEREMHLFIEDRAADLRENIIPALEAGRVVLLDRFLHSSAAYQGRPPLDCEQVLQQNLQAGFPLPHLLFYLEVPVDVCLERIEAAGRDGRDFIETKEHLELIEANYRRILPPETVRVDGTQTPEAVCKQIALQIRTAFENRV